MIAQETANDTTDFSSLERRCLNGLYVVKKSSPLRVGKLTFFAGEANVQVWSFSAEYAYAFVQERNELINRDRFMEEWHVLAGTDRHLGCNLEYAVKQCIKEERRSDTWWGAWCVWHKRRGKPTELLPDECFRRTRDLLLVIALEQAASNRLEGAAVETF